jgi:hypothetical protein
MSLDDLLKEINQTDENQRRNEMENRISKKEAAEEFRASVKPCFDNVIAPTVSEIMETFKKNGITAHYGQDVERYIKDPEPIAALSLSIHFKKCVMQLDITANGLQRKIDFDARFKSGFKLDNSMSWTIAETTKESIEKFITQNVKIMSTHCK